MTTKIIFTLFVSIFGMITIQAQEETKKGDYNYNQPKYNQEHFREISQNKWKKEREKGKILYEIVSNSKDTIRLDSLEIDDIDINIPQFSLIHPKNDDYTILLNLIDMVFSENSQVAFFDLLDQKNAFIFSISDTNENSKNDDSNVRIIGHSQNLSQNFNYKLFKDYLDQNPDVLVFAIKQLNINNKNDLELWGIKDGRLVLISFEETKIEESDGEKFYQENYVMTGIDKIQAICN